MACPASLSSAEWLATLIATEVYLSFIAGHLIAFGGLEGLRQKLDLGPTSWGHLGLAFLVWLGIWTVFLAAYAAIRPVWAPMGDMGKAVLKIG